MANEDKHSRYNGPRVLWAVCYGQRCLGTSVETDVINDTKGFETRLTGKYRWREFPVVITGNYRPGKYSKFWQSGIYWEIRNFRAV